MVIAFTDAKMYATSMTQRNVLKETVPDRTVWFHKPAGVIATVRLSALKRSKQSARPCCPLLKLNPKIYHLNILHLYLAKPNQERVTEFLYQAVELSTSDCSIFTENEGLVQIKIAITNHDVGPDYKLH